MPTPNATLTRRVPSGEHHVVLEVTADDGPVAFTPGQFVNLGLARADGTWVQRPYSIASAPGSFVTGFVVTRVEGGALSPLLWNLEPGRRVFMERVAAGTFTLRDVPAGVPLLAVATGTGTAPFVSMLRADLWKGREVTVVHGARTPDGLACALEFQATPGVRYLPTVTRFPSWNGRQGRVQAVLEDIRPDASATHALVVGNPEMLREVRSLLEGWGFKKHRKRDPGNLHLEAYW